MRGLLQAANIVNSERRTANEGEDETDSCIYKDHFYNMKKRAGSNYCSFLIIFTTQ